MELAFLAFAILFFVAWLIARDKNKKLIEQQEEFEDRKRPVIRKNEWYSHDGIVRSIEGLSDSHLLNAQKYQWHLKRKVKKKLARINREVNYRELTPLRKCQTDLETDEY